MEAPRSRTEAMHERAKTKRARDGNRGRNKTSGGAKQRRLPTECNRHRAEAARARTRNTCRDHAAARHAGAHWPDLLGS
jgi:hypothetical protein